MPSPQQIGRYRVLRRLGSGAFAVVWLAHDDRLDAPVAVKVLADNWAYRMDIRERFLSEARLLRRAGSGGVVQVFDVGELPDERPYFVMEYADLGSVEDLLTAGPLPLAEALRLTTGAARGVASLHEAGIVHRDIKPSNVLLKGAAGPAGATDASGERVLVADLGLAKNLAQATGLTVVAGSVGYMAPEQSDPPVDGIDVRADVYGLGALLYHLMTGSVPGPPGRVLPPHELLPDVPDTVSAVIAKAMAPEREDRFSSAAEMMDALRHLRNTPAGRAEAAASPGPETGPETGPVGSGTPAADPDPDLGADPDPGPASGTSVAGEAPAPVAAPSSTVSPSSSSSPSPSSSSSSSSQRPPSPAWGAVTVRGTESESRLRAAPESVVRPVSGVGAGAAPGAEPVPVPPQHAYAAPASPSASSATPASPPLPASTFPSPRTSPDPVPEPVTATALGPVAGRPARPRRRARWITVAAAVVVLAAGAGVIAAQHDAGGKARTATTAVVSDGRHRISLEVPARWAGQYADPDWDPATLGLTAGKEPALTVAQQVADWGDLGKDVNGVFAGLAPGATALAENVARVRHGSCRAGGERKAGLPDWDATVRTWEKCGTDGQRLYEIAMTPKAGKAGKAGKKGTDAVYAQIRCGGEEGGIAPADCERTTDEILRSLSVKPS
ncbi:protein kinase [Streptomyces sp. NPDC007088]|uniref:serine/threonine-protein kinase n=1 Tax=Streptomyces sp. NPDC007088 TaxID=3364773 RepID=UPI0036C11177